MAETEKKWYVLRAISGKESKVQEYIQNEIESSDLGLYVSQVLIPTEKVFQVSKTGKKVIKEKSYLPGYVLIECVLNGDVEHRLIEMPNVIGFLTNERRKTSGVIDPNANRPAPLRQSEVSRILGREDSLQDEEEEINIPYVLGETVKVTFGPFSGFRGTIEEIDTERKKLKVKVMIFSRETPLELGFLQVEKE